MEESFKPLLLASYYTGGQGSSLFMKGVQGVKIGSLPLITKGALLSFTASIFKKGIKHISFY
jgi:hypothetical protein